MTDYAHAIEDMLAAKQLRVGSGLPSFEDDPKWSRSELQGRLVELSSADASSALTMAFGLVVDAQREGEPVSWVTSEMSSFFPPDAAEGGVDLDRLAVVRVPKDGLFRAADKLARSGAFGLVMVDLSSDSSFDSNRAGRGSALARLHSLAKKHDVAIVFLTDKKASAPSLDSLISLRGEASRQRVGADRYRVLVRALKEKRRAPGWSHEEVCRGPAGLR